MAKECGSEQNGTGSMSEGRVSRKNSAYLRLRSQFSPALGGGTAPIGKVVPPATEVSSAAASSGMGRWTVARSDMLQMD